MFKTVEKINLLEEWKRFSKRKGKNNIIENAMVPINGEHSPRVGVVFRSIVTSISDVTIGPTSTGRKLRFPSVSESAPECQRRTTDEAATLVLTLGLPEGILSKAVEARR